MLAANHRHTLPRGLLLGWEDSHAHEQPRFSTNGGAGPQGRPPVIYDGDAPLMTFAPTGAGKGRGMLIPNALLHDGPLLAIDVKGEMAACCARHRQRMGQSVHVLDPFRTVTRRSGRLNPFDVFDLPGSYVDSDAEMLASLLAVGHQSASEPFWHEAATGLVAGLIAHIASTSRPHRRHLGRVREWMFHDDMGWEMATRLDEGTVGCRMAREQFIAYLTAPPERTRPSIHATACTYINPLASANVAETLCDSTFSLGDVVQGKPLTIFIVIPPDRLESHKALLRLWVGVLLIAIMRRPCIPRRRTLFLIDECAQLGTLPAFRQAVTLLRGMGGLQTWSFWQDLSQLRLLYPGDWQTMVNNSAVVQAFGVNNHQMAREWSEFFGRPADELAALRPEQAVLHVQGRGSRVCRRPDYLRDPAFAGLYDPNPRFAEYA